jgi:phosphomannomutase/phosphoglucomutase
MIERGAVFGGEENGGLIFPHHQYCRDGGMASAAMLEIMAQRDMPLSALVAEVPPYSVVKTKVPCAHERKEQILRAILDRGQAEGKHLDDTDGVKITEEEGWALVRPSGTEPIIRIYAESTRQDHAERLAQTYKQWVESFLAEKR